MASDSSRQECFRFTFNSSNRPKRWISEQMCFQCRSCFSSLLHFIHLCCCFPESQSVSASSIPSNHRTGEGKAGDRCLVATVFPSEARVYSFGGGGASEERCVFVRQLSSNINNLSSDSVTLLLNIKIFPSFPLPVC